MENLGSTTTQGSLGEAIIQDTKPVPGVVVVFANGRPHCRPFPWRGVPLELGRLELAADGLLDSMVSRKHVRLDFDGSAWQIEDLGSRNGTFANACAVSRRTAVAVGGTIRVGGVLLVVVGDILKFQRYGLGALGDVVSGPSLRRALEAVALTRKGGMLSSLLISGESGTGKEIAARVFHDSGSHPNAPFVAVNCATIPKDIAERLLFGSRRGAFSGATDAPGYVQSAHGGTLFLDEVAELPAEVQTKLLRMLQTREVQRLGATSHESVDVRVCAATWRDLRHEVALGRFREDLYFRVGQPEIRLPPLRDRIEEIPWHIQQVLDDCRAPRKLEATASFVDACISRGWPGNVRELHAEVRRAAVVCVNDSGRLTPDDLAPGAGMPIESDSTPILAAKYPQDEIAATLSAEGGNVVGAARRLGIHRNKIRRWLERYGVDARDFKSKT